jgi:1-acyl-sn-glycerol-3-phosphate acyltransferase
VADLVYPPIIGAARTLFRALDLKLEVIGAENVPRTGGAVLVSNHVSYLDFIFAGWGALKAGGRKTRFMAKDEVFRHRVSGPLMRGMKHIPVDRSDGQPAYDAAVRALKAGEVVSVFGRPLVHSRWVPQRAIGSSGTPASAAIRAAPVLNFFRVNERLMVASGKTPTTSPAFSARTAAS